tara:strand:+ start:916 stop:2376 length:1461 start_codon:yes stop_codon:yes gene_type:complete
LSSGLFLGWSLGANDAANVFGTAVGSRMVSFTTAAIICGIFVILGAFVSGTGASQTLGKLGSVNALGGSFMAALSAGLTVYWMTKLGLPVSTSQTIIGSIVGWNLFSDSYTDISSLLKILSTWIICPLLSAFIAAILFTLTKILLKKISIGLIRFDGYTRFALIFAGAFGAYSLGANNISNVVGVFLPVSPFSEIQLGWGYSISSSQQLFLLGGGAIAIGVFTYSKKVMMTVGTELMILTPLTAWVAVMSHSIVLFVFASEQLEKFLSSYSLPTIPLVPVSSSQAVVGAVIGIGILHGGREIQWNRVYSIVRGWALSPLLACLICFIGLYFMQNVFHQSVVRDSKYIISESVLRKFQKEGIDISKIRELKGSLYKSSSKVVKSINEKIILSGDQNLGVVKFSLQKNIIINRENLEKINKNSFTKSQYAALFKLEGRSFKHEWELGEALAEISSDWVLRGEIKNKLKDRKVKQKLAYISRIFERSEM